ncbi:class I SAM-dependent methyltransferase [Aetokthonos hydrillicola Thurmond2011]|jgi:hypothetical protein|uniref:Class I SAM-dependent methyltransferase n=1 Tax=Aetokthonos hydrillicola Thurmond2011 TaxID=2712845 RepID=A0AAP5I5M1_9CYAN|nr:class I SAM-dependent methyltransferase [Aetokthonos hydrillicola]MBO3459378.1 hypothetical protein [Aetokthonos hydrillicola CCALA 1050]MBW4586524.1 class I SAM-dependent methyltransferase [Aetokthonos hydrillicola CCALA 1050]MDR9893533.1 class I SAM-dependent methyltransferase [Aetokthonos hydrillicola Thurmond2011]
MSNQKMLECRFSEKKLDYYANQGLRKVQGWFAADSALVIRQLATAQNHFMITGGVGEIGVHHGKLFILLHLMLRKNERSFAVDIFDKQELNIDKSGKGNLNIFLKNVRDLGGNPDLIDIFEKSSLNVSAEEIISKSGKIRIFSVDGGHTAELTLNDLLIAEQSICDGGIIIIDDYFNAHWPGVSDGVFQFFQKKKSDLIPIIISPNKIFLTHTKYAKDYQSFLKEKLFHMYEKSSIFFGSEVLIFDSPKSRLDEIRKSAFYKKIKNYKLFKSLIVPYAKRIIKSP